MIRKDYILRMIEEIGKIIAAILGLLKKGDVEQAQKLYLGALRRAFDLEEDKVLDMDVDQLRAIFENQFGESFEGLEIIAGLLVKGGDIHLENSDENKAESCYLKALSLYNLVEMESGTYSLNRQAEMKKVTQLIDVLKKRV